MADIVEDLRLLHSGAQWADKATADTLEEAASRIERLQDALSGLLGVVDCVSAGLACGECEQHLRAALATAVGDARDALGGLR